MPALIVSADCRRVGQRVNQNAVIAVAKPVNKPTNT